MIILVDTREQTPLFKPGRLYASWIAGSFKVTRKTLNVGDYTTEILFGKFTIERKSLQDLYGTLIHNHARFRRAILRAESAGTKMVVVVEGTHSDFINKRFPRGKDRKVEPITLKRIIATVKRRYDLEIVFCSTILKAKKYTIKRLKHEERKHK